MGKVLVACEFTGVVRDAFIRLGHDAMSCDLLPTEVDGPHYEGDLFDLDFSEYDLVIAHPPCTTVAVSGNRWYAGTQARIDGAEFIRRVWEIPVERMALENPVGVINTLLPEMPRPYYIQPWQYGHGETKKTGLWTRGLPKLEPTNIVEGREEKIWAMWKTVPAKDLGKERSRTYQGIADAMAEQWGKLI